MGVVAKNFPIPDLHRVRRVLLSVSDKTGIVAFAQALQTYNVELISTGGTAKVLMAAGLPVRDVAEVTGFPEIMDGRVKTLHPLIHGALLGVREDPSHAVAMEQYGIHGIDLLVVNLYPFEETVQSGADGQTILENIDIGGPAMIRAAAKNHVYTGVITAVNDYDAVLSELKQHDGCLSFSMRQQLAMRAYAHTAAYDTAIAAWFAKDLKIETPSWQSFSGHLKNVMRYGENPHQKAAFYRNGDKRFGVATAKLLQGKALSYNNMNDTDAAFELVAEFDPQNTAAVALIKHANPCGVAEGQTLKEAYLKALLCDNVSAFGGIIALNQPLDAECAEEVIKIFTEVIIAPDATMEAREIISGKKNLRLLLTGGVPDPRCGGFIAKTLAGGILVQSRDNVVVDDLKMQVVTKRAPSQEEMRDLQFAFRVVKHVKSNAIVYAKNSATVGIGAGQMSRVDSAKIAARKAEESAKRAGLTESLTKGSVVASDAFFPFADGLLAVAEAGATAVIQPGGSMRDEEVIAAADAQGLAMVFTGVRHFRH
ncbi:bifunctional phosphoribosylaminoimidazolecarboxamide formyltransferase/IMP cyclohydrolase [Bartonella henselae]|uniref:bifunctional phosphoribosylaminoimidazolecarboxamide formyltransferase/IMP cyclohydrolase n=1 Tax=Bartonella henselae TaxID=38323 RepID=UPI000967574B|nr:bifunctional phosphoribosylaminoimidazolecarboxamide formyltransferase/IMP cyclohydrolase [Bartonella henselae]OLL53176.1 bifunctional phosphoribosylaminoimidazolecarboxamide formyltransferase/inosine monophosphate cyclohydrolase [Bartonella henselae]OLL55891.1 bifunctional phosphoribosylaminoimidazolecarboxamide formyltransferase/inosine monophosphate cyclohydrolase [Bartonella henselae]UJM32375.1 bifunctional phosphoribosylaminoimidazolecarboxamide formyltransferase/IMP cyclohydrolase [Bart